MADDLSNVTTLALKAQKLYNSADYIGAIDCLQEISIQLGDKNDVRVHQNLIVARHAPNGFTESTEMLLSLRNIAMGTTESTKIGENVSSQDMDEDNVDNLLSIIGPETSTILFNIASLYFHKHRYDCCRQILEALFSHIEPIGEGLSLKVCFLLLEVLLRLWQCSGSIHTESQRLSFENQTVGILKHVERYCHFSDEALLSEPLAAADSNTNADTSPIASSINGKSKQNLLRHLVIFRVYIYQCRVLVALNQLKQAKKENKNALELYQREIKPLVEPESTSPMSAAIQSFLSLPLAMGAGGPCHDIEYEYQSALYLKANIEYLKANYRKSLKLLTSCHRKELSSPQSCENHIDPEGPVYFNNVACIYLKMERYNASLLFFQKAMQRLVEESSKASVSKDGLLTHTYSSDILYNSGLSLLLTGKPLEAFHCFDASSTLLRDRPHLWLRMAECCVQYYLKTQDMDMAGKNRIVSGVVAKGRSRRIILRSLIDPDKTVSDVQGTNVDTANADLGPGDGGETDRDLDGPMVSGMGNWLNDGAADAAGGTGMSMPIEQKCSLRRAVRYLSNALFLVRAGGSGSVQQPGGSSKPASGPISRSLPRTGAETTVTGIDVTEGSSAGAGKANGELSDGSSGEMEGSVGSAVRPEVIEETALLQLCYVHLCLGDPICALGYANEILGKNGTLQERSRYLAQSYLMEALCALGRVQEASEVANSQRVGVKDLSGCSIPASWSTDGVTGNPQQLARAVVLVNRGAVCILQGKLEEAKLRMQAALSECPNFTPAAQGLLYVLLRKGQNPAEALQLMRTLRLQ